MIKCAKTPRQHPDQSSKIVLEVYLKRTSPELWQMPPLLRPLRIFGRIAMIAISAEKSSAQWNGGIFFNILLMMKSFFRAFYTVLRKILNSALNIHGTLCAIGSWYYSLSKTLMMTKILLCLHHILKRCHTYICFKKAQNM